MASAIQDALQRDRRCSVVRLEAKGFSVIQLSLIHFAQTFVSQAAVEKGLLLVRERLNGVGEVMHSAVVGLQVLQKNVALVEG